MTTAAPSWARRSAMAAPMPREPPWIRATLPVRLLLLGVVMLDMLVAPIELATCPDETSIYRRLHIDKPSITLFTRSFWFTETLWKRSRASTVSCAAPRPAVLPRPHAAWG